MNSETIQSKPHDIKLNVGCNLSRINNGLHFCINIYAFVLSIILWLYFQTSDFLSVDDLKSVRR